MRLKLLWLHVKSNEYNKSSEWEPPPNGWLKCNFDGSYNSDKDATGVDWIIRYHHGKHVKSGITRLQQTQMALQAEALAFLHALQMIWINGWRHVWFEEDCSELTRLINKGGQNSELGNILNDIRYWITKLPFCSLDQVNRERNQAADLLSKKAYEYDSMYSTFSIPPIWLVDKLYYPFTV